ncbi:CIR protein PIR protein [Plasmodium vinckei brucechwatti]|uniref:CIR protein PIR protein n=1 Tax=Plasmodium vinckei brucechwatti TaxID=119398 RepID=A0A6V7SMJ3_PLAVN|nr:CIR protein PIR protein [Plasmodium vinckei brucechwatti]
MSLHVCEILNSLYSQLPDDDNEGNQISGGKLLYETYCPISEERYQKCNSDHDKIKAGFIYLVFQLFGNVNSEGEHEDQKKYYVYYGFLWMSYKLQQSNKKSDQAIGLYDFLNKYIVNRDWYDVVEEYVQPKISMITKEADINLMSDIYYILKEICKFFSINNDSLDRFEDFSKYYDSVIKCGENILKTKNNNGDIDNIDQIYVDSYDTLKNVYKEYINYHNVKNTKYNLPLEVLDIEEIKKKFTHDLKTSDSQKPDSPAEPPPAQDGMSSQTSPEGVSNNSEGGTEGTKDNKGDTNDGSKDPGGGSSGSGSPGDGANGGSKEPEDQDVTDPSGASNGYFPSIWGMNFNFTSYMPNVSGIYQSSKDILTNATNQVSNTYHSAMTIVQETYDKTVDIAKNTYGSVVSTVKDTYTRSTNYISDSVNSITNQLSSFGTFQLNDYQSESNSLGGGVDTSDHSQQNPKQPENPPPSLPPSPSPSQTPPDPQPPSSPKPQSNQIQDTPQTPTKDSSPNPTSSKSLEPQTIPTPIQQTTTTDGNKASQTSSSGQGTLSSSSTDPSTQGNVSTTVTVVKMNEKPSIWCIGSNNKCDITGISIIVISISIILTIIYKYLSLGGTSKSKRKKSVKKVINSIGGKIPIQIIIKSYDRSKDLKPVINSGDRKKTGIAVNLVNGKIPLLNIYKLMQADPIPFINLFFLLIFFVYKRKRNYLEL